MSFSDLMSSARGPGVIGMLIALFVLLGFGTLFTFAFDESSVGGGKSLVAMIRIADKNIAFGKARIESGTRKLATIPALKRTDADLYMAKGKVEFLGAKVSQTRAEIVGLESGIAALEGVFEDYKNQYREHVRNNAAGTKIDKLKTLSGVVYTDVDIRRVTAVGIEIRHRDGQKRIGFQDLPEGLRDHYQYDERQMLNEVRREAEVREKHNAAVALSDQVVGEQVAIKREKDREEALRKTKELLDAKENRLVDITQEIQQLQADLESSERAAEAARASGRMHLSKSNGIRGRINAKLAEKSRVQAEIAQLRASL